MTRPGIEPRSPGPLANTLTARPMWGVWGDFLEDFHANVEAVDKKKACSECLIAVLKVKMNNTAVIPFYTRHRFSSMKLHLWDRLWKFLSFALNFVIKDPFFTTFNDIREKWIISLHWKKTYRYGYALFLILLTQSMQNPNAQFVHFSNLFQVAADCGLECSKS